MQSLTWCGAIVLALATTAPAMAQLAVPQVPGFSNNYPWFNEVPQYQGNPSFQWFLANQPNISGILAGNPGLLYDARWRSQVPALQQYLASHPYEWQSLNAQNWAEGPTQTRLADYDDQHQWRDAYWWHRNNPNRFYDKHEQWASLDSRWRTQDGDYDQQHKWQYGEWWYNQNPNWVTTNHPNWLREHQNWERQAEQQNYRQQNAIIQENQQERNLQQRPATQEQDQRRQQNQQRQQAKREQRQAADQQNQQALLQQRDRQQANLEQQQTMRQENQR
jgi:hypothetical protein